MPTRRRISARCRFSTGSPATRTVPAPRVEDAVEVEDEGGLARAVGAEQRHPFTAGHGQVDAEEGLVAVGVGVGEAADLEGRGEGGGQAHTVHPSRQTARASTGRAAACAHSVREAVTSSITGMVPV